ncbi:tRNA 2-thiouridine(34) synthase MnmA [Candidatus Parcubacteria bacterium]|nr:tRNA 2-thiouridine(34) synthase MnmA [Candidatus Parcubacteria bacterium]
MRIVKKKAVIAISGGLDSSAAAFLLQKQGYEVIGMFMRFGVAGQQDHEAVARRVCQKLNIKFYPINFIAKFKKEVIDYFLDSYARGLTPNPCVKCNQIIKFGFLLEQAKKIGADYLATGHYTKNAKCKMQNAKFIYKLFRGKDKDKDQSYFLYTLTQKQLAKILFPLGDYIKEEVRRIADKAKLLYLSRESQDVCFLSGEHNDFLKKHLKLKPGPIKTLDNKKVGGHHGLPLYTLGQRKGVEIGGIGPFYVAKCDYKTNTLYVVSDKDDPALYSDKLIAENVNWIAGREPALPLRCEAVIRYRHKQVKCVVYKPPSGFKSHSVAVKFNKHQRAITFGQSVVFYQGDEVLGGGIISNL